METDRKYMKEMKASYRRAAVAVAVLLSGCCLRAQSFEVRVYPPRDTVSVSDSVTVLPVQAVADTVPPFDRLMESLSGRVLWSPGVRSLLVEQVRRNAGRTVTGYRLRIFFDNRQTARRVSEEVALDFVTRYPDVPVYRSYVNPYFKVTVGDFRTKSDALQFMERIRREYPSAFLVREVISTI